MTGKEMDRLQRRGFFRSAAARMISPVADYLEKRFDLSPLRVQLRPPGALEESHLIDTCYRCGNCVEACPADAIFALDAAAGEAVGTPMIDPDRAACVVCEGLKCTTTCPSGALLPVADPSLIRMGLADVYEPLCVRSTGEACTLCVDHCPLGEVAIGFADDGPPDVQSPGCIGCGVCQLHCPTSPKAITVRPM